MGLFKKTSTAAYPTNDYDVAKTIEGNPDPSNYKIIKAEQIGKQLIVMINYPDCKNYEGFKNNKKLYSENCPL